jgi:hypothetical protein
MGVTRTLSKVLRPSNLRSRPTKNQKTENLLQTEMLIEPAETRNEQKGEHRREPRRLRKTSKRGTENRTMVQHTHLTHVVRDIKGKRVVERSANRYLVEL